MRKSDKKPRILIYFPNSFIKFNKTWTFMKDPILIKCHCILTFLSMGAQWLSGRVLDSRPRGRGFEPHWLHYVVSLSKTHLSLLSTQEEPSLLIWKIVDWDLKKQIKQTKTLSLRFVRGLWHFSYHIHLYSNRTMARLNREVVVLDHLDNR